MARLNTSRTLGLGATCVHMLFFVARLNFIFFNMNWLKLRKFLLIIYTRRAYPFAASF